MTQRDFKHRTAYNIPFIQPIVLLYAWGQAAQTKLGKLLMLRESSLRLIHSAPYRSHAIPLFNQYNILQLNFQYFKSVCTIMHDVSNNYSLPANISNLFLYSTQVNSFNIRIGSLTIKSNQIRFPTFTDFSIRFLPASESLQAKCSARPVNKHFILS